jgi:DNA polymerase-3 subunit epsilon
MGIGQGSGGAREAKAEAAHDGRSGTPFAEASFVVVDVETTGGSASYGDRVTEVAAVLVRGTTVTDAFHTLVNPQRVIPPFITHLTGITNAMVAGAPRFADIAGELARHLAGNVFVAHNARFDWSFLSSEYQRVASTPLDAIAGERLCTVKLARRLLAHLPRRNLDAVAWHYGVTIDGRHRAAGDARATAHVLLGLLRDAQQRGVHTMEQLDRLLTGGTSRKKRRSALPGSTNGADGA